MCTSDLRLARLTSVETKVWDTTAGGTLTVGPNRQRIGLFFCSNVIMLTSQGALLTFTGGQTVMVTGVITSQNLTLLTHGSFIQQGFTISQLVGNITGRITETILTEEILSAAEREFRSPQAASGRPGYGG